MMQPTTLVKRTASINESIFPITIKLLKSPPVAQAPGSAPPRLWMMTPIKAPINDRAEFMKSVMPIDSDPSCIFSMKQHLSICRQAMAGGKSIPFQEVTRTAVEETADGLKLLPIQQAEEDLAVSFFTSTFQYRFSLSMLFFHSTVFHKMETSAVSLRVDCNRGCRLPMKRCRTLSGD